MSKSNRQKPSLKNLIYCILAKIELKSMSKVSFQPIDPDNDNRAIQETLRRASLDQQDRPKE